MSTIAEIEEAIGQLSPEDFRVLRQRLEERAIKTTRRWTPEELEAAAQRMIDEPDPVRAELIKMEMMDGFYGTAES